MRIRVVLATLVAVVGLGVVAGTASAHSCFNASMAPPSDWQPGDGPLFKGHWVWLPSIGVPFEAWGFDPSEGYIESVGESLLDNSATCTKGNNNRQTEHGVQTGCL
jgi:hypothetical protein